MRLTLLLFVFFSLTPKSSFAILDHNACVNDVIAQFNNLDAKGSNLAVRTAGVVPGRAFTQAPIAVFGLQNHFQGIQRLHNKPYVIITGADWWHRKGYLFVLKLGTKLGIEPDSPFGTNVSRVLPPKEDQFVKRIDIGDRLHWHPGGLGSSGDIVAVTAEEFMKQDLGKIFFFDFTDPENPKIFPNATIDRGTQKAGTVDIFKDRDGHFVVLTYTGGMLYFYRSLTTDIANGFDVANGTAVAHDGGGSVNVVQQCDGQIFLINYENSAKTPPLGKGIDSAFLTKLTFTGGISNPSIVKLGKKDLNCDGYCNVSGAAGSFVSNDGKLSVYSSNFYRNYWGTKLKFKEFPQSH